MQRESMPFDVVIVGAGPAGLSCAIRLKQIDAGLNVCVLEKGSEVGAHILSGNVFEPRALDELLPDWKTLGAPLDVPVTQDQFYYLTQHKAFKLPTPKPMHNQGNYVISLGLLTRWLAEQAEGLGVEIYPGFAASELLINDKNQLYGVATGDMGIARDGQKTAQYTPGMELHGRITVLAEGARGSLSEQAIKHYDLRKNAQPQTYAIGLKELWKVSDEHFQSGRVTHSVGWPLQADTYGGSFLYHWRDNYVSYGFVIGLDYPNPYLNPFEEMQRFKLHPHMKPLFENAERVNYGARALNEGGIQSIPKLTFPGGVLIGCSAGFLNVPKIKGTHTAMKSAMLAAEAISKTLSNKQTVADEYETNVKKSWIYSELHKVRNIRPSFKRGLWCGLAYSALDTYILRGHTPWTFKHHHDHESLNMIDHADTINYPKPDNTITFDRLSSVYLSGVFHEENQPSHLKLHNAELPIAHNLKFFDAPEQRYCPAGVYEIVYTTSNEAMLQINAQNCIHCKTCDIKDPKQNIQWTVPEGGGGPNYPMM